MFKLLNLTIVYLPRSLFLYSKDAVNSETDWLCRMLNATQEIQLTSVEHYQSEKMSYLYNYSDSQNINAILATSRKLVTVN